jgi:hypothetical protein
MSWIRVRDKLPPLDTDVLVCLNHNKNIVNPMYMGNLRVAHMYKSLTYGELSWTTFTEPTHWMMLPEKPKENE